MVSTMAIQSMEKRLWLREHCRQHNDYLDQNNWNQTGLMMWINRDEFDVGDRLLSS